jgi:lysophospholipase L1-like esterase
VVVTTSAGISNAVDFEVAEQTSFVYIASGDSVAAGQDMDGQVENKERAYPRWIRDYTSTDVSLYPGTCTNYNIAHPGDTTTDYLTHQLSFVIGCDPDLVSITIGANELLGPSLACITDNVEKFKFILNTPFLPDNRKIQVYLTAVYAAASGCLIGFSLEINTYLGIINGGLEAISNAFVRRTEANILFTNYFNPLRRTNFVGRTFEDFIGAINALISLHVTANQPRTALVDLLTAFRGHEIGTACSYIAPLRQVLALPLGSQIPLGVHPNAKGQQVIASLATRVMREKGFTPDSHTLSRPFVACATPSSGVMTGGTRVTLHGADFLPGAVVDFGSQAATVLNVSSDGTHILVIPCCVLASTK